MFHSPVKAKPAQRGPSSTGRAKAVKKAPPVANTTPRDKQDSVAEWVNEGGAGGEVKRPPVN